MLADEDFCRHRAAVYGIWRGGWRVGWSSPRGDSVWGSASRFEGGANFQPLMCRRGVYGIPFVISRRDRLHAGQEIRTVSVGAVMSIDLTAGSMLLCRWFVGPSVRAGHDSMAPVAIVPGTFPGVQPTFLMKDPRRTTIVPSWRAAM